MVLLADSTDPVGHAVVQRQDGTVVDPNEPSREYPSLGAWRATHPDYRDPQAIPQRDLKRLFSTPPGPARDAAIQELGLQRVASRQVADGLVPTGVSEARATEIDRLAQDVTDGWDLVDTLSDIPEGPERDYVMHCLMERESPGLGDISTALGEFGDPTNDFSQEDAALVSNAMASAYDSGMITNARARVRQPLARRRADGLPEPGRRPGTPGPGGPREHGVLRRQAFNGSSWGVSAFGNSATLVGDLLRAASSPRNASTDAMVASVLGYPGISESLNDSSLRGAVANYLSSVRHPTDSAERSADAAQWDSFLASSGGGRCWAMPPSTGRRWTWCVSS